MSFQHMPGCTCCGCVDRCETNCVCECLPETPEFVWVRFFFPQFPQPDSVTGFSNGDGDVVNLQGNYAAAGFRCWFKLERTGPCEWQRIYNPDSDPVPLYELLFADGDVCPPTYAVPPFGQVEANGFWRITYRACEPSLELTAVCDPEPQGGATREVQVLETPTDAPDIICDEQNDFAMTFLDHEGFQQSVDVALYSCKCCTGEGCEDPAGITHNQLCPQPPLRCPECVSFKLNNMPASDCTWFDCTKLNDPLTFKTTQFSNGCDYVANVCDCDSPGGCNPLAYGANDLGAITPQAGILLPSGRFVLNLDWQILRNWECATLTSNPQTFEVFPGNFVTYQSPFYRNYELLGPPLECSKVGSIYTFNPLQASTGSSGLPFVDTLNYFGCYPDEMTTGEIEVIGCGGVAETVSNVRCQDLPVDCGCNLSIPGGFEIEFFDVEGTDCVCTFGEALPVGIPGGGCEARFRSAPSICADIDFFVRFTNAGVTAGYYEGLNETVVTTIPNDEFSCTEPIFLDLASLGVVSPPFGNECDFTNATANIIPLEGDGGVLCEEDTCRCCRDCIDLPATVAIGPAGEDGTDVPLTIPCRWGGPVDFASCDPNGTNYVNASVEIQCDPAGGGSILLTLSTANGCGCAFQGDISDCISTTRPLNCSVCDNDALYHDANNMPIACDCQSLLGNTVTVTATFFRNFCVGLPSIELCTQDFDITF